MSSLTTCIPRTAHKIKNGFLSIDEFFDYIYPENCALSTPSRQIEFHSVLSFMEPPGDCRLECSGHGPTSFCLLGLQLLTGPFPCLPEVVGRKGQTGRDAVILILISLKFCL